MPKKLKARAGDTLCSIAIRNGFADCGPLRQLADNDALTKRPLKLGDTVTVPPLKAKTPVQTKTGKTQQLTMERPPIPRIRLVHGSAHLPLARDTTLDHLDISNFPTDKAGRKYQAAFSNQFGFDADAHLDPDAFKVELCVRSTEQTVSILLEALKPLYDATGKVKGYAVFTASDASDHAARKLTVDCKLTSSAGCFRSKYLRLVTDNVDNAVAPTQTLLVTDIANGNAGAEDQVEILDQQVRASFPFPGCKVAEPDRCKAIATLPVGKGRKRARVAIHVFRAQRGSATLIGGLTEQTIRRRMFKWFRRAYAQAAIAPRLVAPIEIVDPPSPDMLVISQDHGRAAAGGSVLSFTLGVLPPAPGAPAPAPGAAPPPQVSVNLTAGQTPAAICAAVVTALPNGFRGAVFPNPPDFTSVNGSCDLIVSADDGHPVVLRNLSCNDTLATAEVAAVNLNAVDIDSGTAFLSGATAHRRVLRAGTRSGDRLDYFLVKQLGPGSTRGIASVPGRDLPARFQSTPSLSWAVLMGATSLSGPVMDGGDNLPFTMPHESGHVLNDAFHADSPSASAMPEANTEMMRTGTTPANAVTATKRICDSQKVKYQMFKAAPPPPLPAPAPGTFDSQPISAVDRMRRRGAQVLEEW